MTPGNPTPALVTQRAAQRLPRLALLLLCAAYVLPGLVGRDPWKSADVTAFGYMVAIAEGRAPWLAPTLGGLPIDAARLPHWIGAGSIALLSPWVNPAFAARVPFALLLALTLALVWYTTFHLARTEAAQPVPFAFGGEASAVDYARAMADGALLALIASLGLLQLGHETTPELVQLFSVALFLWGLAAAPFRNGRGAVAAAAGLWLFTASGAPAMAMAMGVAGTLVCRRSAYEAVRQFSLWLGAATVVAALLAQALGLWGWRVEFRPDAEQLLQLSRLFIWFLWPTWLMAVWTLWRWRHHLLNRHIAVPASVAAVAMVSAVVMGGSDRALMLALPGMAVLAAFALPTMKRSMTAAIDWFSVFFFTACAIAIWVVYSATQTGVPAKTLSNVMKLAPGFTPYFSALELLVAIAGTAAWLALVRWRTGAHRHALWKSLVLPASGVALCWLLLMTLWLPLLDYARSYRPWVQRLAQHIPADACIAAPQLARAPIAALEYFGGWVVDGRPGAEFGSCAVMLVPGNGVASVPPDWTYVASERRPTDRDGFTAVFRRTSVR